MKQARSPLRGYLTTLCIWALMEVGLWERLAAGGRISIQAYAKDQLLEANILNALCNYLERVRLLEVDGDQVCLSRKGRKFWDNVYGVYHLFHAYTPLFSTLLSQLKGSAVFGKGLSRIEPEVARGFDELGRNFMYPIMEGILKDEGFQNIIDLGCGEAYLSRYLCKRNPAAQCLAIDHDPSVLESARHRINQEQLESRITLLLADMFDIEKVTQDYSQYHTVTAIDLFHGYFLDGEEKLLKLFRTLQKVFRQQKILISEICMPSTDHMRHIAYPYVEHELFHDLSRQKSFRRGELESIVTRAGFDIIKSWNFNEIAGRTCLLLQSH